MSRRDYFALSRTNRFLHLCGVPINILKKPVNPNQFNFHLTSYAVMHHNQKHNVTISPSDQHQCMMHLLTNIDTIGEPVLYCIGSFPTETPGLQFANYITTAYSNYVFSQKQVPQIKWVDLGRPDWNFLKSDEDVDLFILYGVNQQTSDLKRIEIAKDFLNRASNATALCLITSNNVLGYVTYNMGLSPDAAFQLGKTVNRVIT